MAFQCESFFNYPQVVGFLMLKWLVFQLTNTQVKQYRLPNLPVGDLLPVEMGKDPGVVDDSQGSHLDVL